MNYKDFMELVKKRRKVVSFTDEAVKKSEILQIVDAARYAPSGMNFQPWEFVVVTDKKMIEEISFIKPEEINIPTMAKMIMRTKLLKRFVKFPAIINSGLKSAKNAPVLIVVCGDTRKCINLPGQRYKVAHGKIKLKKPLNIADVASIYASSMSAAFQLMLLAATSLGLGTQYLTLTSSPIKAERIKKLLKLPDHLKIYDTLAIGHPAYKPRKKYLRKLDEMVHFGAYNPQRSASDETIVERLKKREDMRFF